MDNELTIIVNRSSVPTLGSIILLVSFILVTVAFYLFIDKKKLLLYIMANQIIMLLFSYFFLRLINSQSPSEVLLFSKELYVALLFDVVAIMYLTSYVLGKPMRVLKLLSWLTALLLSGLILLDTPYIFTGEIDYTSYYTAVKGSWFFLMPLYSIVVSVCLIYEFFQYKKLVNKKTFMKAMPILVGVVFFVTHTTFIAFTSVIFHIFKPTNHVNVIVISVTLIIYYYNDLKETTSMSEALYRTYIYDELTQVHTRNYCLNEIERLLERRYITDSYVAFMDIDGFKQVNDYYGHLLGDKVLKMLGEVLNGIEPKLTTVGRLGGDEFIILFDEMASSMVLNELEQVIHNYIYGLYELGVDVKETGSGLSIGAVRIESGMSMKGVLSIADEAMYEAKRSGKNKVVYYG